MRSDLGRRSVCVGCEKVVTKALSLCVGVCVIDDKDGQENNHYSSTALEQVVRFCRFWNRDTA